ncbi:unnamed protein product [Cylindrotheca closterium]|uniref:HSF-type DNA-binding domain-containing protein n=1 Tax=Cylindrotheca closterium TaxID=2856 RepID=A0AAD2G8J5_9STRA|nr:unnamed protein product [Cylindrotheca closterium]
MSMMNPTAAQQRNIVPAPDDGLLKLDFDDLPEDLPGVPQLNMKNLSNNMKQVSGSMNMLDSSLFEFGQSVEKPRKQNSSYEVDMNLPFPIKLHYILSNPAFQDCIAWLPHGRAWKVTDQKGFESKVIPKFFRSDRMASFMRQVNGWAFNRITEGPDMNAYYHDMFLRGIPNLCFDMRRPPKVKHAAAAARLASGAGFGAPDFDRINKVAPLPKSVQFKPVLKDAKGNNSDKYGLEIIEDEDDDDYVFQLAENSMPNKDKDSSSSEPVSLSKADIHYLEHQNEILFSHGGLAVESSFNL